MKTFSKKQVVFIAEVVMAAAVDRIESSLPDTITLEEYQKHKEVIDSMIATASDTAAMTLAIFFAQTTGEGMGVWDWAGSKEFRDACEKLVAERTSPKWEHEESGDIGKNLKVFAKYFAEDWSFESNADRIASRPNATDEIGGKP
jgi:L-rhamnose mutarotase